MTISVFNMRKYIVHIALLNKLLLCNLKCLTNNPLTDEKKKKEELIYLASSFLDGEKMKDGQDSIWRCFSVLYKDDGGIAL